MRALLPRSRPSNLVTLYGRAVTPDLDHIPAGDRNSCFRCAVPGVLALAALALAAYWPILPGNFLMDDRKLIETANPLVNGALGPLSIWFQSDFPLSTLAFWLQWLAWGQNPAGYHAVNIALHVLSAALLWLLLARLKIRGAWLAAALYAVHPVCVATVARIAELKNTLSLPFFLLSLWGFLRYDEASSRRASGAGWLAFSLIAFVLALLAKTSTVMLPFLLLAFALWQRGKLTRQDLLRAGPFFALALGFGAMSVWFQKHQALAGASLAPQSFLERLALSGRIFWFYLGKALWPSNLNLFYPQWKVDPATCTAYIPLLLCVGFLTLCWWLRRGWGRPVLFGLACFVLTLFPALGFFNAQYLIMWQVSDHLQYLSLIAPLAMAAAALACLPRVLFRGGAVVALVCLCVLACGRARVFSNEDSLFRDSVARNPLSWNGHNYLGVYLAVHGKRQEAQEQFEAALQASPKFAEARANLGKVLLDQGRTDAARTNLLEALKLDPNQPEAHRLLGFLLARQGKTAQAIPHLRIALLFKPDIPTRLFCAGLLHETRDYSGEIAQYRHAVREQPRCVEALNNLAWLLATTPDPKLRNGAEAVRLAEQAMRLPAPKGMCVPGTLAAAYAEAGRFPDAVATAQKAVADETAAGETRFAALNEQLLALYRAGRPFHETEP